MSALGGSLLGVFSALLVVGTGALVWAIAQPRGDTRRVRLLAASATVALAGLVGAIAEGASAASSGGMGGMMGGGGMGGMMGAGGNSGVTCPSQLEAASSAAIRGFRFCPTTLRVQPGTTVTWTNDDNVAHTVTSQSGPRFDSGSLAPGRSWSHRFDRPGTYSYYCAIHPWMLGRVDVVG